MICGLYIKSAMFYDNNTAVIDTEGGVSYSVHVPVTCRPPAEPGPMLIYHHMNERGQSLYGFYLEEDRTLFENLIDVDGVGPTAAIKLMGNYEPEKIRIDIGDKDAESLSKAKGIGLKTAQKIVDALASKYGEYKTKGVELGSVNLNLDIGVGMCSSNQRLKDTVELAKKGLIKLGFKVRDVEQVLTTIVPAMVQRMTLERTSGNDLAADILKRALQELKGCCL